MVLEDQNSENIHRKTSGCTMMHGVLGDHMAWHEICYIHTYIIHTYGTARHYILRLAYW